MRHQFTPNEHAISYLKLDLTLINALHKCLYLLLGPTLEYLLPLNLHPTWSTFVK